MITRRILLFVALLALWPAARALDVQTWRTDNGVRVLFVETHALPIVDVRLAFKAGSSRDDGLYGISRLVSALLVEGTGDLSAEDIALTFESAGAQLGHDSLRDMAWTSLRSLSDEASLDKTADLFARVTALPSFPADAIERDRKAMLVGLANRQSQISDVAVDAFFSHVYEGHAYEVGSHGTEETLKAITRDDLLKFHGRYYVANNANLAIVGDLTPQQARDYANRITRHLKPGQPAAEIPDAQPAEEARTVTIPFKTTQTHIKQGLPVLSRKDPDYFALYLGNHIFGGSGFSSRLMQEIREDRGLTYSVYSYFLPMENSGPFEMALQTSNHQVQQAADLMNQMLREFIEKGPTAEEIEHAKRNITGGFPLKTDSNKKIVEYMALIGFYDLPLDYLDTFNDKIMAINGEDIRDAFQRRVNPDRMIRVIVGQAPSDG